MSAKPAAGGAGVRVMQAADLDGVVAVENASYDFPWSRGIFSDCLIAGYHCYVAEADGGVVGYAIMTVAAAEGHILNLCVSPAYRQRGLGRRLLGQLLERAGESHVERLFLEVRPSNPAAIELYTNAGFRRLGVRRNYYKARDGREDALVLVYDLPPDV